MARKKYRRRSHTKKSPLDALADASILLSVFLVLSFFWMQKHVFPTLSLFIHDNFTIIIWVTISIVLLIFLYVFRKFIFKNIRSNEVNLISEDQMFSDLILEIKEFQPLKRYSSELPYQTELAWYLKRNFKWLAIEVTRNDTRPDIVVEDIAIEIKWPTTSKDLHTIADKIIRYLKHYDKLIVVLFSLEVNEKEYREWKGNVLEAFAHSSERLEIIEL